MQIDEPGQRTEGAMHAGLVVLAGGAGVSTTAGSGEIEDNLMLKDKPENFGYFF